MKRIFMPMLIYLMACSAEEEIIDYISFFKGRSFESYRYVFEGNEYDEFLVSDYYLKEVPNTILQAGDCVKVYTRFLFQFYDEIELDFYRIRESYRKCNSCTEYVIYDKTETLTQMTYHVKKNFIVLANENGWNPNYYEIIFIDDNNVRINKCQPVGDFFAERDRKFHEHVLPQGVLYYVDIYMRAE